MKKHVFLGVGIAALYLAAKEYGIHSLDDLKRTVQPYLKYLQMGEDEASGDSSGSLALGSSAGSSGSRSGNSGGNSSRSQSTPVTHES